MPFRFLCPGCGQTHEGMPAFDAAAPLTYYSIPPDERERRCRLESDECVIDDAWFFVRGCLEITVIGETEPFSWGVFVSLSADSYRRWKACFHDEQRSHVGPFFGWLDAALKPYPDSTNLKTRAHLRDGFIRPLIELEPTAHPLAVEQREGITAERVARIYATVMHGTYDADGIERVADVIRGSVKAKGA
jgi:hypothetical protein